MRSALTTLCLVAVFGAWAMPAEGQRSAFGSSVVASDTEVIVGEPGTNFRPGTVYVYARSGSTWSEAATLTAPDAERADGFGSALARDGSTLFVGQGERIHVYQKAASGSWEHQTTLDSPAGGGGRSGRVLATAGDWLLVGMPGAQGGGRGGGGRGRGGQAAEPPPPGSVLVLQRSAGGWTEQGTITSPEAAPGDAFGAAIAVAEGRAVVGAPGMSEGIGKAFVFRVDGSGQWTPEGSLEVEGLEPGDRLGSAVALSGDLAIAGAPAQGGGYGAAYVYGRDADTWSLATRLAAFDGGPQDRFGSAVGMRGTEIWVGAPPQGGRGGGSMGSTYVFQVDAGGTGVTTASRLDPSAIVPVIRRCAL